MKMFGLDQRKRRLGENKTDITWNENRKKILILTTKCLRCVKKQKQSRGATQVMGLCA